MATRGIGFRSLIAAGAVILITLLSGPGVGLAVPTASGYTVSFVTTPGAAAGDVVFSGGAIFVGSGAFGVGTQSIVRIDGGGSTVLASGFNSLGGMQYDPVGDRLLTGDNGGEQLGALTGDTVYAIPNPFGTPGSPAAASTLELLPMGSVAGYSDLQLDPSDITGDTLFIGDSAFPPGGGILEAAISSGTTSVIQTGLAFTGGLATDGTLLYFGESFASGDIHSIPLANPTATRSLVANVPAGQFDTEYPGNGSLLTSAGGEIIRIDPVTGNLTSVASGFGFTGGIFEDASSGIIYALDGFASVGEENRVWIFTPVPEPGTALLCALGLAGLSFSSRRRSDRAS